MKKYKYIYIYCISLPDVFCKVNVFQIVVSQLLFRYRYVLLV